MLSVIEIDREHDLAYILLRPELRDRRGGVSQSLRVAEDIVLDLDDSGQLVGIELLNASSRLNLNELSEGTAELIVGVKEAAEMVGVEKSNFVRDYANKPNFPAPIAELASGRFWLRADIERYVQSKNVPGRRPNPRFSKDEAVQRTNQPEVIGIVRDVRWDRQAESWNYSVQVGGQLRVLPEESLQPVTPVTSPWDGMAARSFSGARHFIFTLTYHRLRRPPTRIAYSFATSRTQFYPHQFTPLLKFLDHPGKRMLIADDVGLGKTIEAGYILRELRARQVVERVLVVVPARLAPKWKREFQMRFDESFDIVRRGDLLSLVDRVRQGRELDPFRWIISYENARPEEVRIALETTQPPIDVLIVDEAHRLRNPESLQHKVGAALCRISDTVLFLSATPVQNSLDDLWNLLRLLSPEEFADRSLFQSQVDANRPLLQAQRALAARPARCQDALARLGEFLSNPAGAQFAGTELVQSITQRLRSRDMRTADLVELQGDFARLSPTGHIITRTRKVDALPNRPRREAGWIPVPLTSPERKIYENVESLCRLSLSPSASAWGYQMALLQTYRMTASCIPAAMQYFAERLRVSPSALFDGETLEDTDDDEQPDATDIDASVQPSSTPRLRLSQAVKTYERIAGVDTKLARLVEDLQRIWEEDGRNARPRRKVVVFSTFRRTLEYLRSALTSQGIANRMIHGGRPVDEREVAIDEFLDRADILVLLASEVGGEGIDLQRASVVVNYDLPWNPMVVEQRIGRVDRIGQTSPRIVVMNMVVTNSVEERILQRLLQKIGIFEESIGELDPIIGEAIERLTERALRGDLAPDEVDRAVEETGDALHRRVLTAREMLARLDGLLAADQAIIDEINAVTDERQLPAESEMRLFLNEFLGEHFPGCQIPEEATRRPVALHFEDGLGGAIEDAAPHFGHEAPNITRFARRLLGGPVEITLSREASYRHPQADLLHLRHPLVRFAVSEIQRGRGRLHKTFALSLERSAVVEPGLYLFALSLVEIPGYRPTIRLACAIADLRSERAWSDPEQTTPVVLELLQHATDCDPPPLFDEEIENAKVRIVTAIGDLLAEWSNREQRLDHGRREQQLSALRTTFEFRLRRTRERLQTLQQRQSPDFAVRMAQAQFDKAQQQFDALAKESPAVAWRGIEQEEIAVGILCVGSGQ